jgi:hypothetical protein
LDDEAYALLVGIGGGGGGNSGGTACGDERIAGSSLLCNHSNVQHDDDDDVVDASFTQQARLRVRIILLSVLCCSFELCLTSFGWIKDILKVISIGTDH